MPKAKRKRREAQLSEILDGPTEAQLANGDYTREFVTNGDTSTKSMAHRNRDSFVIERWLEDETHFPPGAVQAVRDCQFFWNRLKSPRIIANYGERIHGGQNDGIGETEALSELKWMAQDIPDRFWSVFENVARWNEPAGVAGSAWAKNTPQQIQSAKVITGFVACLIAQRKGY